MFSWTRSWRKLVAECGMAGFRFQDLRHTFRTWGAEAGVPLEVMMAQLGHMDRETSLEYVHIQQRALERAQQVIESEQKEILATAEGRKAKVRSRAKNEQTPAKRAASKSMQRQRTDVSSPALISGRSAPGRPQLAAGLRQ
jgi:site-specific recombinase XerD